MLIKPLTLGAQVRERIKGVEELAAKESLLKDKAREALIDVAREQPATEALNALHKIQRLYLTVTLGLENEPKIAQAINDPRFLLWSDYAVLPATEDKRRALSDALYEGDIDRRAPIVLLASDYSRKITEQVLERCAKENVEVNPWINDALFDRRLYNVMNKEQAFSYGTLLGERYVKAERSIGIWSNNPSVEYIDESADEIPNVCYGQMADHIDKNCKNQFFTLTLLPTEKDAELDLLPYQDYVDLFFDMCAIDKKEMDRAHKHLIMKLNAGSILNFKNSDGTDLTMNIAGSTFANSLMAKNVPGSEVFSAPQRESVNGRIVAKGRFVSPKDSSKIIENITMNFKDGKIVQYEAEAGLQALQDIIETDEGSHYLGEIGIGTNPMLQRHVVNSLMVEKIGGSFHVAVGYAYTYKEYLGMPVKVDNGNRSQIHWDMTTMLVGKKGMMTLDGEILMENGRYCDKKLAHLNGPG